MSKFRITILAILLAFTMSMPTFVFAYGDYTNYTKGSATIGTVYGDRTMDYLADYYYDENNTYTQRDKNSICISFTDDMRSSFDSYAKIKTYADSKADKYPASYLFDAGNFSMGNPYQTIFESEAAELRVMGATGYDAVALGSSELSHGASGLEAMLKKAKNSGDQVPNMVAANISGDSDLTSAFKKYGVKDYIVVNNYGVKVAVFGIIGKDSFDSASADDCTLDDPVDSANKVVSEIKKNENVDMIVCLANTGNGGSDTSQSAAKKIAGGVDGIDLIISGNNTASLTEPVEENGTEIVSAGEGSNSIGTVVFTKKSGSYEYKSYKLQKLNSSITDDYTVSSTASRLKNLYNSGYFSKYGFTYGQKLTTSDFDFPSVSSLATTEGDNPLGDIIADAYLDSDSRCSISAVSAGAVSDTISSGKITAGDAFAVLSKGTGNDGKAGYQLVKFSLTGAQIKALAEKGSKAGKSKADSKLYFGGLTYSYNPHRISTNRVYDMKVKGESGRISDSKSYSLITDAYTFKQIKALLGSDANITSHVNEAGSNGNEQKAWSSLASYLDKQGSTISSSYAKADGRVNYDTSFNPVNLFKQPNKMVGVVVSIGVIIIAVLLLLIIFLVNGIGGRRYRGGFEPGRKSRRKTRYPKQAKEKPIFSNKKRF